MRPRRKVVTWRAVAPIVALVGVATIAALVWYVLDDPPSLAAAEVRSLLIGNTIEGTQGEGGARYRQYNAPDGTMLFAVEGAALRPGRWRLGADGAFCTDWDDGQQSCFRIGRRDGVHYWIDAARGLGYPFEILQGRRVDPDGAWL